METTQDLLHEAHTLAEQIRVRRSSGADQLRVDNGDLDAMEHRLIGVWNAIRASRAAGPNAQLDAPAQRRTRPKWG